MSQHAPTGSKEMCSRTAILLLLALCGILYFTRLGSLAFFEEDEPRFASAVRTMLQTGDYVTPRFNGKLRINKPILFYWLASGTSAVVGVGELGARLPSAILGTATVLMLFLFGRRQRGVRFGFIAGLALVTCLQLSVLARAATADMSMIFFLTAALLAFYHAYAHPEARGTVLLSWAALGFAALAKGPAAVVLAAGVVGVFLLARGELLSGLRRLCTPAGILLFLAIAVPWYALELKLLGKTFYRGFFLAEHFGRVQGTADSHRGPLWFYAPVLLGMFHPWVCFLPAGLAGVLRERRQEAPLRLFAFCWVVVVFGIFTVIKTKLPHYIAPLYPAAALLVAAAWEGFLAEGDSRAWRASRWVLALWGGAFVLVFAALVRLGPGLLKPVAGDAPIVIGPGTAILAVVFAAGWASALFFLASRQPAHALGALGGSTAAGILCTWLLVAPVIARYWQDPLRDLAIEAAARAGARGELAILATPSSGVVYYSQRTVARVPGERAAQLAQMAARGPLFVITSTRRLELVPPGLGLVELRREGGYVLLGPDQ